MTSTLPLQIKLVDSFAPLSRRYPARLCRLPRGFPARGVDSHFPDAHPFGLPVHVAPLPAGLHSRQRWLILVLLGDMNKT
jgi:hypothetical protein